MSLTDTCINDLLKTPFDLILSNGNVSHYRFFFFLFENKKVQMYAGCRGFSTLQCSAITVSGDAARDSHSTLQTRHETQPEQRALTVI